MKKIVCILAFILFINSQAFAKGLNIKPIAKPTEKVEEGQTEEVKNTSAEAVILYNCNNIDEAMMVLKSIPEEKRTALDWLLMGNIYQDNDEIENAAIMFKKSTLVDLKFYRGYYNLAYLYLQDENPKEAIKLLKIALRYKPDFSYAYYNLGTAYIKIGDLKKARNALLKAIEHKGDYANAYYNLVYVYSELGNTKKAEEYLKLYNELNNR